MSARFVLLTAGRATPVIAIQRPVLLIGRHPDCDVRIDLPQVSRRHCCLAQAYDRLLIRDLGSRNGVRVNGRLVDEARLEAGDEIAIAQVIYRLESGTPASPTPLPEAAPAPVPVRPPSPPAVPDDEDILVPLDDDL
jgi:predicted component of type VI protein secretion system